MALDGTSLTLTELGESAGAPHRFEGREAASTPGERRFRIGVGKGLDFPNGRFVLRGDEAEVTLYGSGVPVVRSERGKLLLRRP